MRSKDEPPFEKFIPQFVDFEWDELKRQRNLDKHKIDFVDVLSAFDNPLVCKLWPKNNEVRYLAIGLLDGQEITIAYQERSTSCRIISARPASKRERATYRSLHT